MSCQDFKKVVEELAEGRLMDVAGRDAGLAHAAVCVDCAAHLMEARGLAAGLRVAARAETEEAPARVRAALLASFAERHRSGLAAQGSEAAVPSNVFEPPARRAARWWFAAGVAAAAAVVLLSLFINSLVRFPADGARPKPEAISDARPLPAEKPAEPREEKPGILVGNDVARKSTPKKAPVRAPQAAHNLKRETPRESSEVAQVKGDEYLPLTYLAGATAMESGTVVRVELSRSALISLGVPVELGRSDETLKADVVLGDDGVARAIRLVR